MILARKHVPRKFLVQFGHELPTQLIVRGFTLCLVSLFCIIVVIFIRIPHFQTPTHWFLTSLAAEADLTISCRILPLIKCTSGNRSLTAKEKILRWTPQRGIEWGSAKPKTIRR